MDIKLRNNRRDEKPAAEKKESKFVLLCKGLVLYSMVLFLAATLYLSVFAATKIPFLNAYNARDTSIINDSAARDYLLTFANKLCKYYVYYNPNVYPTAEKRNFVMQRQINSKRDSIREEFSAKRQNIYDRYDLMLGNTSPQTWEQHYTSGSYETIYELAESPRDESNETAVVVTESTDDQTLIDQINQELTALQSEYDFTENQIIEMIIEENDKEFIDLQDYFANTTDLRYSLYDRMNDISYSNESTLPEDHVLYRIDIQDGLFWETNIGNSAITQWFERNQIEGTILIPDYTYANGDYYDIAFRTTAFRNPNIQKNILFFLGGSFILLTGLVLFIVKSQRHAVEEANIFIMKIFFKLPFVIKLAGLCTAIAFLIMTIPDGYLVRYIFTTRNWVPYSLVDMVSLATLMTSFQYVLVISKNKHRLKEEPEIIFIKKAGVGFLFLFRCGNWIVAALALSLILAAMILNLAIFSNMNGDSELILVCILIDVFAYLGYRLIVSYAKLIYYIKQAATGNFESIPYEKGLFTDTQNLLRNITNAARDSMQDMLKSERLKTELITNVSHDLKTPLTSIISYIELLKEAPHQDEKAKTYVEILDKKSQRLKILIEDLFEASKLSSGNVELELSTVDVVHLLQQSLAELNEKIESSNITFKLTANPEHIFINLDGKKMWRVFENLVCNILKYSLPHSRAYISAEQTEQKVIVIFKSTSSYELDNNIDELFERFKRADKSRATEGSGLGLTIAKNIVELHGGIMAIDTDGDLFKVTVELPLSVT